MDWNPDSYAKNARFVSELGAPVVQLLSPQPEERILDLGCGDGALTKKLLDFGCDVVGVDSSPEMVAAARSLGLDVSVMDGSSLEFENAFDAVFSNAAMHWMGDLETVTAGVWRALKSEGRFVGEFGGYGNVSLIVTAIESALLSRALTTTSPWCFPRANEYRDILQRVGFVVDQIEVFSRPTILPGNIGNWLRMFAGPFMSQLSASDSTDFISEVVENLRGSLVNENGDWVADYVRIRFSALKVPRLK